MAELKTDYLSFLNWRKIGLILPWKDFSFLKIFRVALNYRSYRILFRYNRVPARWLVAFHEISKSLNLPYTILLYLEYVPSELNLWVFIISNVSRSMKHTPPSLPPTIIRLFWWDIIRDAMPLLSSFNSSWVCGSIYCRVKRSQQLISALNQHFREPPGPIEPRSVEPTASWPPRCFWLTITAT